MMLFDFFRFVDPTLFIGLGLSPHIEAAVEYLKSNWRLPGQFAPYAASVLALAVQLVVIQFYHVPINEVLVNTVFSTMAACFWHEASTKK